jgi:hypothetical protein
MPQYFNQELFFRQLTNWLLFFYFPEQKGPLLVVSVIKHIHSPEYEASAHYMHVRQLLTASCGITARQCIVDYSAGFPGNVKGDLRSFGT